VERATTEFDINLSGDDEFDLPPGVQVGSLYGDEGEEGEASSIPPPKPGEFLTDPEEEKERDEDVALEVATPVETPASSELETEQVTPKPKPKAKKRAARKPKPAAPEPVAPAPAPGPLPVQTVSENANQKATSGTIDRPYRIFQYKAVEVDGQIIEVPVPVIFNAEGGGTMDTLVARNRDLALRKAARAFGPGWAGTLVAVPIGYWEPEQVLNRPRNNFTIEIGEDEDE
jgi:hypothetical protein